jgi:hypothetical protein
MANELGLRNVSFEVGGIGGIGGIGEYENSVRMAYVRGPEGSSCPCSRRSADAIIPRESGQVASPPSAAVAFRRGALREGRRENTFVRDVEGAGCRSTYG